MDLPHSRFGQYWDILHQRYDVMGLMALWLFLSAIPFIVAALLHVNMTAYLSTERASGDIDAASFSQQFFLLSLLFYGIEAVCLMLLSVPIAGAIRVLRLLAFGEGVFFKDDFLRGIKENVRSVLLVFALLAALYFVSFICAAFLIASGKGGFWNTVLFLLPLVVSLIGFLPVLFFVIPQISIYQNRFIQNIKNGFSFYIHSFYKSLPLTLLIVAPFALPLLGNFYVVVVVMALYFPLFLPLALLAFYLLSVSEFDALVNKEAYPEIYHKGIYPYDEKMREALQERKANKKRKRMAAKEARHGEKKEKHG